MTRNWQIQLNLLKKAISVGTADLNLLMEVNFVVTAEHELKSESKYEVLIMQFNVAKLIG